uniref:Major facilitator superfamily (MFS) profile domain-containing protein n=1 Tax=Timema tahoe TaxID=61484 RepID=A0A7R9IDT0_9NEOP|nr:unnamed protein product [Timema tahoe]
MSRTFTREALKTVPEQCRLNISTRLTFGLVACSTVFIMSAMGSSVPVAIIAMVKPSTSHLAAADTNLVVEGVCPERSDAAVNEQGVKLKDTEGEFDWDEITQSYIMTAGGYGSLATNLIGARLAEVYGPRIVCGTCVFVSGVLSLLIPVVARWNVWAFIVVRVVQGGLMVRTDLCVRYSSLSLSLSLSLSPSLSLSLSLLIPVVARWNVWAFIVVSVVQGGLTGPIMPGFMILFASWVPPSERGHYSGIIFSAVILGSLFSMLVSGNLATYWGWESIFYFYGFLKIPFCVVWVFMMYDSPLHHPRISEEEKDYIVSNTKKDSKTVLAVPWLKILLSAPVWAVVAVNISVNWVSSTLQTELPIYMRNLLHFNINQSTYLSALPHIFQLFSNVFCGVMSQWLRSKGYVNHLTAYRIFNAIAMIGPAIMLIVITQVGCDTTAIIVLLIVTMVFNGAFFGGSMLNHMDIALNFAGSLAAFTGTIVGLVHILAPTIAGAITNNQSTPVYKGISQCPSHQGYLPVYQSTLVYKDISQCPSPPLSTRISPSVPVHPCLQGYCPDNIIVTEQQILDLVNESLKRCLSAPEDSWQLWERLELSGNIVLLQAQDIEASVRAQCPGYRGQCQSLMVILSCYKPRILRPVSELDGNIVLLQAQDIEASVRNLW